MEPKSELHTCWRHCAKEIRALAGRIEHPDAVAELKAMADQWDAKAKEAETRAERLKQVLR